MKHVFLFLIAITCIQLHSFAQVKGGDNTTTTVKKTITLKGTYSSKRGVMTEISCYGFNVGILTSEDKTTTTNICFDKLKDSKDLKISCDGILQVTGYYEMKTIDGSGSCLAGSKTMFYVEKWKCVKLRQN